MSGGLDTLKASSVWKEMRWEIKPHYENYPLQSTDASRLQREVHSSSEEVEMSPSDADGDSGRAFWSGSADPRSSVFGDDNMLV